MYTKTKTATVQSYVDGIRYIKSLTSDERRDWLVAELNGTHILDMRPVRVIRNYQISSGIPINRDLPVETIVSYTNLCPTDVRDEIKSTFVNILMGWVTSDIELSAEGLKHLLYIIGHMRILEAKHILEYLLSGGALIEWTPTNHVLPLIHSMGCLSTKDDIYFWMKFARKSPEYRVFVFGILLKIEFDAAQRVLQTIHFQNKFHVHYLEQIMPNFRDYILDPALKPTY